MSDQPFEVESSSSSIGAVFARALEGGTGFKLAEDSTLDGALLAGVRVPRALDSQGKQRQDLFGFYLRDPSDASRFRPGTRVVLKTRETPSDLQTRDALVVLGEAVTELRNIALVLYPDREDFLTALTDETAGLSMLDLDPAKYAKAAAAVRELRNAIVHGVEVASVEAGFENLEDYLKQRLAPEVKSLRMFRSSLGRAA